MEIGYFTMPLHPPGSDFTKTIHDDLEQMVVLDDLGYAEAWIGEHFTFAWENIPSPDLFIAQALAMTQNIVFGTGVSCMPNHNPFMLAHRIAQLDHMAKGRFYWGVGSSSTPGDQELFDFDPDKVDQRALTREAVDLIIELWRDPKPGLYEHPQWRGRIPEPVEEIGLKWHLGPYQKPHPPIGVAGVSPKSDTLLLAGERGWMPMSINFTPAHVLQSHWESVEEGARNAGKTADRSKWRIAREVYVADTTEEARRDALEGVLTRDYMQYWMHLMGESGRRTIFKVDPDMPDSELTPEYFLDNIWIVGSPDDVADQIREIYDDVGGFGVLLAMGHDWEPRDKWLHSMSLLAKEVMPKLADLR